MNIDGVSGSQPYCTSEMPQMAGIGTIPALRCPFMMKMGRWSGTMCSMPPC